MKSPPPGQEGTSLPVNMWLTLPLDVQKLIITEYCDTACVMNKDFQVLRLICWQFRTLLKNGPCRRLFLPICAHHNVELLCSCLNIVAKMITCNTDVFYLHDTSVPLTLQSIQLLHETMGIELRVRHLCCDGIGVCLVRGRPSVEDDFWCVL